VDDKAQNKYGIAIAMPIYNESEYIADTLNGLVEAFSESKFAISFVIQNDASTDKTLDVLRSYAEKSRTSISIESNKENVGHGPTTYRAYQRAVNTNPKVVLQLDSDGQFVAIELIDLCQAIIDGHDVAIGDRKVRQDPWFRKFVTLLLRGILSVRYRKRFADPNSPVRAYEAEKLDELLGHIPQDALIPNIYLSILHVMEKLDIFEKEISHRPRKGTSTTGTMWQSKFRIMQMGKLFKFCLRAVFQLREFRRSLKRP
jgi:glycosyltransferase involved in cell wall biosynthesis